jgi:predicted component of type VI protein secretion system
VASYVLVYQSHRVVLPDGVVFVGRGIECHVRFNAPTVSRRHLRLELEGGVLRAENLSSTTGTLLNDKPLAAATALRHGDRLVLGPRELRVEHLAEGSRDDHRTVPAAAAHADVGHADTDSHDDAMDDVTRPGDLAAVALAAPPQIAFHTCPRCRARVDFDRSTCPACGHTWELSGASAMTQRITQRAITAPAGTPMSSDVPVVYASDEMTIDAVAREIRADGLFLPTELLDPEGTACEVTLLADGEAAMVVRGVVAAVRAETGPSAPAGLEIRFTDVGLSARAWLDTRRRGR